MAPAPLRALVKALDQRSNERSALAQRKPPVDWQALSGAYEKGGGIAGQRPAGPERSGGIASPPR